MPGEPMSLHVRPLTNSIIVSWTPPSTAEHNVMIRGYILGYGIGVPDVYRQILDANVRYHTIKGLGKLSLALWIYIYYVVESTISTESDIIANGHDAILITNLYRKQMEFPSC